MATQDSRSRITVSEAYQILAMEPCPIRAADIQEAVADPNWQLFRCSLKGLTTESKLRELHRWFWAPVHEKAYSVVVQRRSVQVINYVNALKRGGLIVND